MPFRRVQEEWGDVMPWETIASMGEGSFDSCNIVPRVSRETCGGANANGMGWRKAFRSSRASALRSYCPFGPVKSV